MSDELIEAVAKALNEFENQRVPHMAKPWSLLTVPVRDVVLAEARAALSAIEAAGFVVVPKEPTDEMVDGALGFMDYHAPGQAEIIYGTMLSLRPKITGGEA